MKQKEDIHNLFPCCVLPCTLYNRKRLCPCLLLFPLRLQSPQGFESYPMASVSKKTLSLSDKKKEKRSRKSSKPESGSGFSAYPDYFDYLDCLVNKPIVKELAEKMAGDADFDKIAEQFRTTLPRIPLLKEMFPEFDPEDYINLMLQNSRNPRVVEATEKFFDYLLPDRQMSRVGTLQNVDSKTPDPAGHNIGGEDAV